MKKVLFLIGLVVAVFAVNAQTYNVNTSKSELKWTGKKVGGEHWGNIALKDGTVTLKANKIVSGKFVIDMKSITVGDLAAGEWNDKLVGHLKSEDFFGVENFPEAVLELTGSSTLKDGKAKVKGKLTIKGITNPVEFDAVQDKLTVTAQVTVDRSKYNVRYGSGKFFDNLGDKTIYDNFTIDVKLVANEK